MRWDGQPGRSPARATRGRRRPSLDARTRGSTRLPWKRKRASLEGSFRRMKREWPGAFLARGTRTLGRCSFDVRSKRQPWTLPHRGSGGSTLQFERESAGACAAAYGPVWKRREAGDGHFEDYRLPHQCCQSEQCGSVPIHLKVQYGAVGERKWPIVAR